MAYRTYVGTTGKDSIQILGNNESYRPFLDELKKQGVEINSDCCFHGGNIKDLQPIIEILEQYIYNKDSFLKPDINIFDLRPDKGFDNDLTFRMSELRDWAYIFVTAKLIDYLGDNIELDYDLEKKRYIYKIKEGKEVWFEAY